MIMENQIENQIEATNEPWTLGLKPPGPGLTLSILKGKGLGVRV